MPSESKSRPKRIATTIFKATVAPGIVQERLVRLSGVLTALVNPVSGAVWVEYNPRLVTEKQIKDACLNTT